MSLKSPKSQKPNPTREVGMPRQGIYDGMRDLGVFRLPATVSMFFQGLHFWALLSISSHRNQSLPWINRSKKGM